MEGHEEARVRRCGESAQRLDAFRIEPELQLPPRLAWLPRPAVVCGQQEFGRDAGQGVPPVLQLGFQAGAFQLLALKSAYCRGSGAAPAGVPSPRADS
jgi:hypothetical protein